MTNSGNVSSIKYLCVTDPQSEDMFRGNCGYGSPIEMHAEESVDRQSIFINGVENGVVTKKSIIPIPNSSGILSFMINSIYEKLKQYPNIIIQSAGTFWSSNTISYVMKYEYSGHRDVIKLYECINSFISGFENDVLKDSNLMLVMKFDACVSNLELNIGIKYAHLSGLEPDIQDVIVPIIVRNNLNKLLN